MSISVLKIFPNTYRDSVELLRIAADVQKDVAGVVSASAMMATDMNKVMLSEGKSKAEQVSIYNNRYKESYRFTSYKC